MKTNEPIIFRQGEENGIIIERENFENSIMLNQYQQAINIFHRLWSRQEQILKDREQKRSEQSKVWVDNNFSNVITFSGDRGEGKSSCMASFATLLTDNSVRRNAKQHICFPKDENNNELLLASDKIEWLDVIDPSFFDNYHNVLDLLLGRLCENANKKSDEEYATDCTIESRHRKFMEKVEEVRHSIQVMTPTKDKPLYESIEDTSELAAAMQLRDQLQQVFRCYLNVVGKECLLICIDDLDLNITQGHEMAEWIRKYLINPYCILLISVNINQLVELVANDFRRELSQQIVSNEQCEAMAHKYVAKLLPRGNRVPMPAIEDICERTILLAEQYGNEELKDLTVKERVVQLIFQKTGYVFYNGQYLSPIIPTNLRELRHFLGTMQNLPDARDENNDDDETGRDVFKDYFFNTWVTANLDKEDYDFAQQLSTYTNVTNFNAFVVEYFAQRVKNAGIAITYKEPQTTKNKKKNNSDTTADEDQIEYKEKYAKLYQDITNKSNTAANISLGDVMYVLWLVSTITVANDLQNLIFFIKTVYSIKLYGFYNQVTINKDSGMFPDVAHNLNKINIHKADTFYDNTNILQRLVNGSYFTYPQGEFLESQSDRFILNTSNSKDNKVKALFDLLKKESKKSKEARNENYIEVLKMCEFLALTIPMMGTQGQLEDDNFSRTAKTPAHLGLFSHTSKQTYFDFLQPFYSVCNIKYAYNRFDEIMSDSPTKYDASAQDRQQGLLYKLAEDESKSLLYQFKTIRYENEPYDPEWDLHGFVSDSIISVIDVQTAIYDELLRQYRTHRTGSKIEKIYYAYQDIRNLKIKLYPKIEVNRHLAAKKNGEHNIDFRFLNILKEFLDQYKGLKTIEEVIDSLTGESQTEEAHPQMKE